MRSTENLIQDVIKPKLLEMTEPTFEHIWDDMIETFEKSFNIFEQESPDKLVHAKSIKLIYYCSDGFFLRSARVQLIEEVTDHYRVPVKKYSKQIFLNNNESPKYLGNMDNITEILKDFLNSISEDVHLTIQHQDWSTKEKPEFMVFLNLKN